MSKMGHNSEGLKDRIQKLAVQYAKCDEASMKLNDERAEIRQEIKDMGLDTKAWQDRISRAKQSIKKREGYDEACQIIDGALGQMDMQELWSHVIVRENKKIEEREARAKARAEEKAKDDEYKPAEERKPKKAKSVGEQQVEAMKAAGHA